MRPHFVFLFPDLNISFEYLIHSIRLRRNLILVPPCFFFLSLPHPHCPIRFDAEISLIYKLSKEYFFIFGWLWLWSTMTVGSFSVGFFLLDASFSSDAVVALEHPSRFTPAVLNQFFFFFRDC